MKDVERETLLFKRLLDLLTLDRTFRELLDQQRHKMLAKYFVLRTTFWCVVPVAYVRGIFAEVVERTHVVPVPVSNAVDTRWKSFVVVDDEDVLTVSRSWWIRR
jgi:hypothetical protein